MGPEDLVSDGGLVGCKCSIVGGWISSLDPNKLSISKKNVFFFERRLHFFCI